MDDMLSKLKNTAMDLLSRREHSRLELFRKLKTREFDEESIEKILDELNNAGWQSDERYAEVYVQMRANKGYGPIRIRQELIERGISTEIINLFLESDKSYWQQLANSVRIKKFGNAEPEDFNERAKQLRFLQYRGFAFDQMQENDY